jgi:phospholipid/cholesterol/gamma-HCH transport system substrate-binding protein
MIKQAPTPRAMAAMALFALSCFGIMLFLWTSFGGSIPLAAKGYRYYADFGEATQLTSNADVRISGVTVGRVTDVEPRLTNTRATIEIDHKYAPIAATSKAILRAKTLLGETYIEITPGRNTDPRLKEEAVLPGKQVLPTTELDEILRALDPATRKDLQKVLAGLSHGLRGRGQDLNQAIGHFAPFAEDSSHVLRVLDSQHHAVERLVRDTGQVLGAVSRRQGQLGTLVSAGDRLLATTARRNRELTRTVQILPTTLQEMRPTMDAVAATATDAAPVVRDLRPGGRVFGSALRDTSVLAPRARALLADVDRLATVARTGLPAGTKVVESTRPVFQILDPALRQLVPVVQYLGLFKQDLITSFSNLAAATQATMPSKGGGPPVHYLRVVAPFTEEGFAGHGKRLASNRHNPYFAPEPLRKLPQGLEAFDCSNANGRGTEAAPLCKVQPPIEFQGKRLAYPHVDAENGE